MVISVGMPTRSPPTIHARRRGRFRGPNVLEYGLAQPYLSQNAAFHMGGKEEKGDQSNLSKTESPNGLFRAALGGQGIPLQLDTLGRRMRI